MSYSILPLYKQNKLQSSFPINPSNPQLKHPNTLRLSEYFETDKKVIIVTEYFKAPPMNQFFVKHRRQFKVKTILLIFHQLVQFLRVLLTSTCRPEAWCSTISTSAMCSSTARPSSSVDSTNWFPKA